MKNKYRSVLVTEQDITEELLEQSYVKGCRVEDKGAGLALINVRLSVIDFIFNRNKRVREIHSLLRPRIPFTMTYELRTRLL